ncbi:MAG TPA: hypothetical protein VMV61_07105 [Patescibacteria group bacterium]|nr:hypothetical protein [Patescibacteria group bacterium]
MDNLEQKVERAALARQFEECQRKVAATEAELRRIGAAFVELGSQLQSEPSKVSTRRMAVEKDLAVLWLMLPEYIATLQDRDEKKAALDRLE